MSGPNWDASDVDGLDKDLLGKFKEVLQSSNPAKSETTSNRYCYEVVRFARWLSTEREKTVWEVQESDLRVHLRELHNDGYAESTITARRSGVSQFYKRASEIAEDYPSLGLDPSDVPSNPSADIDRSWSSGSTKKSEGIDAEEGIHYLYPDEIEQLVQHVPAPSLRNSLIVKLLYDTGCRRDELAQVTLDRLDRGDHTIQIPASTSKSKEDRIVTYTPGYVQFELDRWLDGGHRDAVYMADESDYLFPTQESEHISGYRINEIVKEAAENAGIQSTVAEYVEKDDDRETRQVRRVTAHTIRHSHCMTAIRSGIDVRTLMKTAGHQELSTTLTYLKIAESEYVENSRQFKPTLGPDDDEAVSPNSLNGPESSTKPFGGE